MGDVPLHLELVLSGILYVYCGSIVRKWAWSLLGRVGQAFSSRQFVLHGPFCTLGDVPLHLELVSSGTSFVWSRVIFWAPRGRLPGPLQQKICLAGAILYFVCCTCTLKIDFKWYLIRLIKGKFWGLWGVPRGHTQQGVPGRHPYLHMVGYTIHAYVFGCWYLVRLIKLLWAAGLRVIILMFSPLIKY